MSPSMSPETPMTSDTRPHALTPLPEPAYYQLFGLILRSDYALGALPQTAPAPADISFVRGPKREGRTDRSISRSDAGYELYFPPTGRFTITGPDRVEYDPTPDVDARLVEFPLLGPVMGLLLHLRGYLVLHGSAIRFGDRAAVFLGHKGAGKSTLAAACLGQGLELLTDDLAVFAPQEDGSWRIIPAFAQLKLSEAAGSLMPDESEIVDMTQVHEAIEKRHFRGAHFLASAPVIPGGIFTLQRASPLGHARCAPLLALPEILAHAYLARFGIEAIPQDNRALNFRQCAALSEAVPICRLNVPEGIEDLPKVVAHIAQTLSPEAALS